MLSRQTATRVGVPTGALLAAVLLLSGTAHADSWRDRQWHLDYFRVDQVHALTKGEGVTVAVVDTGADVNHPDLKGNVLEGVDVVGKGDGRRDTHGHGTAVTSLIAAHGHGAGGDDGVLGLAPGSKVTPIRALTSDDKSAGDRERIIEALEEAVGSGAKVINFSATMSGVRSEVERAFQRDIVFVAGAGNTDEDLGVQQPASYPGVIAVAGIDRNGTFTDKSVEGPEVVLTAPAVDVATAWAGDGRRYVQMTGTSAAAALVSATAALIRAKYPDLSANGVINRLIKTADDKGPPGRDPKYGFGVVNPLKALTADIPDIGYNPLVDQSTEPSPASSSQPSLGTIEGSGPGRTAVLISAVGAGVVAAVVVAVLFRNRRRRGESLSEHAVD